MGNEGEAVVKELGDPLVLYRVQWMVVMYCGDFGGVLHPDALSSIEEMRTGPELM